MLIIPYDLEPWQRFVDVALQLKEKVKLGRGYRLIRIGIRHYAITHFPGKRIMVWECDEHGGLYSLAVESNYLSKLERIYYAMEDKLSGGKLKWRVPEVIEE
jgi:hypothetical protein